MLAKHKTSVTQPQTMVFQPQFDTNLTQSIFRPVKTQKLSSKNCYNIIKQKTNSTYKLVIRTRQVSKIRCIYQRFNCKRVFAPLRIRNMPGNGLNVESLRDLFPAPRGEGWLKTSGLKSAVNTPLLAAGCFIA